MLYIKTWIKINGNFKQSIMTQIHDIKRYVIILIIFFTPNGSHFVYD